MDVAHAAVVTGIAPGPAEAVVEHLEALSWVEIPNDFGLFGRTRSKGSLRRNLSLYRFGIMRGDYASGERDVGQILAVGVEAGVGCFGRPGEGEFVSAGGRRPALGR